MCGCTVPLSLLLQITHSTQYEQVVDKHGAANGCRVEASAVYVGQMQLRQAANELTTDGTATDVAVADAAAVAALADADANAVADAAAAVVAADADADAVADAAAAVVAADATATATATTTAADTDADTNADA